MMWDEDADAFVPGAAEDSPISNRMISTQWVVAARRRTAFDQLRVVKSPDSICLTGHLPKAHK